MTLDGCVRYIRLSPWLRCYLLATTALKCPTCPFYCVQIPLNLSCGQFHRDESVGEKCLDGCNMGRLQPQPLSTAGWFADEKALLKQGTLYDLPQGLTA